MSELETILEHHGVKGMKWGVRRSRSMLARARAGSSSKKEEAPAKFKGHALPNGKKRVTELDTKELQDLVNRLNLEKQYAALTAGHKKADGFTKNLIKEIGKEQVTRVARAGASVAVENLISKHGGANGAQIAKRLAPKKK